MMTFGLEYGPGVKQHKASYGGPSLMGYIDSNYAAKNKNR